MFEPRNPRVPGVGLAPQRDAPEPAQGGIVDALFARRHLTAAKSHVVVRVGTSFDEEPATSLTEQRVPVRVVCGGTTAEA